MYSDDGLNISDEDIEEDKPEKKSPKWSYTGIKNKDSDFYSKKKNQNNLRKNSESRKKKEYVI